VRHSAKFITELRARVMKLADKRSSSLIHPFPVIAGHNVVLSQPQLRRAGSLKHGGTDQQPERHARWCCRSFRVSRCSCSVAIRPPLASRTTNHLLLIT
jgi:hypothetical protein